MALRGRPSARLTAISGAASNTWKATCAFGDDTSEAEKHDGGHNSLNLWPRRSSVDNRLESIISWERMRLSRAFGFGEVRGIGLWRLRPLLRLLRLGGAKVWNYGSSLAL